MSFRSSTKSRWLPYASAAITLLLFCGNVAAQKPVSIRVAGQSVIEENLIRLDNIASVSGPEVIIGKLRVISLGYSPDVGATRTIRRQQILLALRSAGFSDEFFALECDETVSVHRSGQVIPKASIRQAFESSILKGFRETAVEARLVRVEIPDVPQVSTGEIDVRVNSVGVRNIFEVFSVPVELRVNGRLERTIQVFAQIEAYAQVLVASVDLAPNSEMTPSSVRFERVRLSRPVTQYFRDEVKLHGTAAVRQLRAGSAITIDAIMSLSVVKPGDRVKVETASDSFQIVIAGEARAAGRIGDKIAVKNIASGTVLQATVIDKGVVRISL